MPCVFHRCHNIFYRDRRSVSITACINSFVVAFVRGPWSANRPRPATSHVQVRILSLPSLRVLSSFLLVILVDSTYTGEKVYRHVGLKFFNMVLLSDYFRTNKTQTDVALKLEALKYSAMFSISSWLLFNYILIGTGVIN